MKSINRNWATDFTFSGKFCFLGTISTGGGQMPVFPPADAHVDDAIPFVKLVQKFYLVTKSLYYGYLRENIYN